MKNEDRHIQGAIVEIYGDEYKISSDVDVAEIQRVAAYVDRKMRELEAQSGRIPKGSLAVLVAMEITAELFQAQGEKAELVQKAYDSIDRLNELIEQRSTLVPMTSNWMERRRDKKVPL